MRDIAATHLWPSLHREWLPRLEAEPQFMDESKRLLRIALLSSKFSSFESLNEMPIFLISSFGGFAGGAAIELSGGSAGVGTLVGGLIKKGIDLGLGDEKRKAFKAAKPLTAFYQKLKTN
jgi:hypothetical protein